MSEPKWIERAARQGFKYFNHFMIAMWRLGLGGWINFWPEVVGRIMVIKHYGRKSELAHWTPVNFVRMGDVIYCVAGYGKKTDWYRNVRANPRVEVWLPDGWWEGTAEELTGEDRRIDLIRQVLIAGGFASYAAGINPRKMDDPTLEQATANYCLMRIQRGAACTGAGGPSDLSWIWPLATMILLPLVFLKKKNKH
jgi:deazaflavin-dependent oxidoreductase (nitroreductase family)